MAEQMTALPDLAAKSPNPVNAQARIPLSRLSPELIDRYGTSPGYRVLANMARDGHLRTEIVNGRHFVPEASLPALAAALGLTSAAVEHAAS